MTGGIVSLTLAKTAPLLLAAYGGLLSELSGVINFALEGMMLAGAFAAVWATHVTGSPWIGLLAGAGAGTAVGLLHALAALVWRANQIVSSIALNLLVSGMTGMLLNEVFQVYGTSPGVTALPVVPQSWLRSIPVVGDGVASAVGGLSIMAPAAPVVAIALMGALRWSVWGLRLRACGENPAAAAAAGISVTRLRFLAVMAGGALAGLGGAYLSIGELSQFVENMTRGRGFLAIAAVILGRWTPGGVLLATLLFGLGEACSEWLAVRSPNLPHQVFLAFPYVVCFAVLMFRIGGRKPPSALGRIL